MITTKRPGGDRRPALAAALVLAILALSSCAGGPAPVGDAAGPPTGDQKAQGKPALDLPSGFAALGAPALIKAFSGIPTPDKADWQILLADETISFDSAGGHERRAHWFLRIVTKAGVEAWSIVDLSWQPWRDQRPLIKARVIRPSGAVSLLDPATIVDQDQGKDQNNLRSDSRRTSAPLPNLEAGSLVELDMVMKGHEALAGAGWGDAFALAQSGPVESRVFRFERPASLPFSWKARGAEPRIRDLGTSGGLARLELSFGPLAAIPEVEQLLPYDVPGRALLSFSSAPSWETVSSLYKKALDPLLDPAPVSAWARKQLGSLDPSLDQRRTVRVLFDAVRKSVRYTGVYFGENAIIPHAPADILGAGYGDCKDQAVLLAASLKAAGVEAELSLLSAGTGTDISPEVPGLEFFNHAIVRVASLGIWLDPTSPFELPGQLPTGDRARSILPISDRGGGLLSTPTEGLEASWISEARTIVLSESGAATSASERTTTGGTFSRSYRSAFSDGTRQEHVDNLIKYGKDAYDAPSASASFSDPLDLDTPFIIDVAASEASLAWTDESRAAIAIKAGTLFSFLPDALGIGDKKAAARKGELYLPAPPSARVDYAIVAPPGYRITSLPDSFEKDFGVVSFSATFSSPEPGRVEAGYRLRFSKARMSAAEVADLREKAGAFLETKAPVVIFSNIGKALVEEGRLVEALNEFKRLQALHPAEALHHIEASDLLIDAGFADESLLEAREAVRLEPDSARAHKGLAYASLHDAFGRQFGKGSDPEAAKAEYRRAFELDKKDYSALFNRAIMQENNSEGTFAGPGSDLPAAVATMEEARDRIEEWGHSGRYLRDLFLLGRLNETVSASATLKDKKLGASYLLAALALKEGADSAVKKASAIFSDQDERRNSLKSAANALLGMRAYPEAAELMLAAARGTAEYASMTSTAALIKAIKKFDPDAPPAAGPRGILMQLMTQVILKRKVDPALFAATLRESEEGFDPSQAGTAAINKLENSLKGLGLKPEAVLDIIGVFLAMETKTEGPVTLGTFGAPNLGLAHLGDIAFVQEEGSLRILGLDSLAPLAAEADRLAAAGDLAGAEAWIKAGRDPAALAPVWETFLDDELSGIVSAVPVAPESLPLEVALISQGYSASTKAAARHEAALLAAARAETGTAPKARLYAMALAYAEYAKDPAIVALVAEAAKEGPGGSANASRRALALLRTEHAEEAEKLMREAFAARPSDKELSKGLARVLASRGAFPEAIKLYAALGARSGTDAIPYNNAAWYSLFLDKPDYRFIDDWKLGRQLADGDVAEIHTLVCVFGAAGRYEEARAAFGKILDKGSTLDDQALWVAHGFLALSFGLKDRARESFQKAVKAGDPKDIGSSAALAQYWLGRL